MSLEWHILFIHLCGLLVCLESLVSNCSLSFSEEEGSYRICRRICDELDVPSHGSADYAIIREVAHAVSDRSASIVAAGNFLPLFYSLLLSLSLSLSLTLSLPLLLALIMPSSKNLDA